MAKYKSDSIDGLLPAFRTEVQAVLDEVTADGYEPVLFDALRTKAEAVRNATKGTGIKDSIHCYGAAADVICGKHGWSCAQHGCGFYGALAARVRARKLVCGADFSKVDQPHFQGISIKQQAAMRALGTGAASLPARNALVVTYLERARAPKGSRRT